MKSKIKSILADESFLKELEEAIESGKSTDYAFNGEYEYPVEVFEVDTAKRRIVDVLKRYFVNE